MEKIYLALSGLNSLDPVALIGTTTKYEFNDIHNWTSHVFIACAREDIELETVQTVMKHLRETINFAQFDDVGYDYQFVNNFQQKRSYSEGLVCSIYH